MLFTQRQGKKNERKKREGGRMNVRKKEGRSMRRNNYLPVTRDPQFRGASVSLHLASVRPVTMVRVLREVQTERGRGEPGGGRQHLSLQEPAGGSAQMQQPALKELTGKARQRL